MPPLLRTDAVLTTGTVGEVEVVLVKEIEDLAGKLLWPRVFEY
jgi:hypothetical protein